MREHSSQSTAHRDHAPRLGIEERLSWRQIADRLGIPTMTARDAYTANPRCTESVPPNRSGSVQKTRNEAAAE
jgi:hypothetical protein